MLCEKAIEQLSAYLDGQLTAAEREAVRSHVAGCARCRGELDALDRAARAVAGLPRLQAPSDLRDQVMAKLDRAAPAETRRPRWRMYWGAAAAVVFAVVIMFLTTPATSRRTEPEAVAPAGKNVPGREAALADRGVSAGSKGADEKLLRTAATLEPSGGTAHSFGVPAFGAVWIAPVSSEQIVLPSADPRASYFNAVAVAAKGGWLPAEQRKRAAEGELLKSGEAEQSAHQDQVLQFVFRMKRSQVPLLKSALAAAGLRAAEEKGGRAEAAQQTYDGAPRLAPARTDLDEAAKPRAAAAPMTALQGREDRITEANGAPAAAAPAPAAMKAPESVGGAEAVRLQQPVAEQKAQRSEAGTLYQTRKDEAAEEPLVQVTLLFPLAESPVPAAPPAAGAANSATPE